MKLPPEPHGFNSMDEPPGRPNTAGEHNAAVRKILENSCAAPDCSSEKPAARMSEESPLPRTSREKAASFLTEPSGFPPADARPEAATNRPNWYESMSRGFGHQLRPAPAATCAPAPLDLRAVNYENCFKCQGERCHPPPRVARAQMYPNRNVFTAQSSPARPGLKKSQSHDAAANEDLLAGGDGSQSEAGQRLYEETNGGRGEGKRPLESSHHPSGVSSPPPGFKTDPLFVSSLVFISKNKKKTTFSLWYLWLNHLLVFSLMFPFLVLPLQPSEGEKRVRHDLQYS